MERLGVFLCTGCGIGQALNLEGLGAVAKELRAAACITHPCLCAPEGVEAIRSALAGDELGGILLAACSPRAKQAEFRFDPTRVAVERVSLREHVVWSHPAGEEDTQLLAEDLLRMGMVRLAKMTTPKPQVEAIERTVLVVGGGVAGLEAARAAAGAGHPVVLVEAQERLGGHLAGLRHLVPERPPYDAPHPNRLPELIADLLARPQVRIFTSSQLRGIAGQPGQFRVEVETPQGMQSFAVGAIVQATGAHPYEAPKLSHLGYSHSPNIMTSHELEAMLRDGILRRPSDLRPPQRVVFIQCAGSRDPQHLVYCSAECCATTLKQVAVIHREFPGVETVVLYRDMRTPGQLERFYQAVQEQPGSLFARGEVERVEGNGAGPLTVYLKDSLLGNAVALPADLVVLAVGMVPDAADGEAIRALHDAERRAATGESETQRAEARKVVEQLAAHEGTEDPAPGLPPGAGPAGAQVRLPRFSLHLLPL